MASMLPTYNTWISSNSASVSTETILVKDKVFLRDQETDDIYEVFVKNGKLICQAEDISVRREDRLKKLLDE